MTPFGMLMNSSHFGFQRMRTHKRPCRQERILDSRQIIKARPNPEVWILVVLRGGDLGLSN